MRVMAFNKAVDPVAVGTDDDWHLVDDARILNHQLVVPPTALDLYDFHVFIFDTALLGSGGNPTKDLTGQLEEMVRAGCVVICFIHGQTTLSWLSTKLKTRGGAGTETEIVVPNDSSMGSILARYHKEMSYGAQLDGWEPMVRAPNGYAVAAAAAHGEGWLLALPHFDRRELVVRDILQQFIPEAAPRIVERTGGAPIAEDTPMWVDAVNVPGTGQMKNEIDEMTTRIAELEEERATKIEVWKGIDRFRELLWAKGETWLEPLVKDALELLGVSAEPDRPIDLVHRFESDRELWIEVEGTKGCTQVGKGGQLLRYMANDPERAAKANGAIIGNPFRLEPPDGRPPASSQEEEFSKPLRDLATKQGWTLLTTRELFSLLCRHLSGDNRAAAELREKLQLPPVGAAD